MDRIGLSGDAPGHPPQRTHQTPRGRVGTGHPWCRGDHRHQHVAARRVLDPPPRDRGRARPHRRRRAEAAQRAAYVTRPAKSHTDQAPLREQWADRAATLGYPANETVQQVIGVSTAPITPHLEDIAWELFGPDGLTGQRTSFDRRDVIQALIDIMPTWVTVTGTQLEAIADQLLTDDDAVPLLNPTDRNGERRWSTRTLLAKEAWALTVPPRPIAVPTFSRDDATAIGARSGLSTEQQQARLRPMRPVRQPIKAAVLIARQPHVQRLTRHPEPRRHSRHRLALSDDRANRLIPLLSHRHLPHTGSVTNQPK